MFGLAEFNFGTYSLTGEYVALIGNTLAFRKFVSQITQSIVVISEFVEWKLTKFVWDVAESSPYNRLETASQSSIPLSITPKIGSNGNVP